jgi:peptidoglycan/LPS O-acetylase OafA/YrhL
VSDVQRPATRSVSVSEGLSGHRNSFGVIRLVLASSVIFSHAFPLGGWGKDPLTGWSGGQENFGGMAVLGFFAISGYLITKSGMRADGLQFIWRRVLRILPAFYTVLIVTAFVVGPIAWVVSGHPLATYFSLAGNGPVHYLIANADLAIRQYGIYDIFATTTPYGETAGPVFNGALWTLTYEWGSYLIIWLLVIFGVLTRAKVLVPVITAFYFAMQLASLVVPGSPGAILPYFADAHRVNLPLIFLYGACIAVYAGSIPLDARLAALSAILVVASLWQGGLTMIGYPALAYFIIWLAAALPERLQWIGAKNDYSYGMYVYGFLVQQVTAALGWYRWGYLPWVLVTLIICAGCAWLSWHGVEKRAMMLKDWGPGRGIAHWREWLRARTERRPVAAEPEPSE